MNCIDNLFVYKNAIDDLSQIAYCIKNNIPLKNLYCIIYRHNKNRVELINTKYLFGSLNIKDCSENSVIIGVAFGYDCGIDLIKSIVTNCIENNRDIYNKKNWFL